MADVSGKPITASVMITNPRGHLLIVLPARGDGQWVLPGGIVEEHESPLEAARREVHEELNLQFGDRISELVSVEWLQATRPGRRDRLALVYASPQIRPDEEERIRLDHAEITMWRWMSVTDLVLLHPRVAARIAAWLQCPGTVTYQETWNSKETLR
ncbi:NUDIX domain-containing protein [Streptomyces sp. I05A-00742]|uniref:NUDIX domain-containing protein n=1 Tax=Streptomyces sp. I05A-00742 TaxID=2732853 RepID=UPI001488F877|nr:NUDIX hydrolase [Streptomyces sp. I05A-00742]